MSMRMRRALRAPEHEKTKEADEPAFYGVKKRDVDAAIATIKAALGASDNVGLANLRADLNGIERYFDMNASRQNLKARGQPLIPAQLDPRFSVEENAQRQAIKDIKLAAFRRCRERMLPTEQLDALDQLRMEAMSMDRSPERIRMLGRVNRAISWVEERMRMWGLLPVEDEIADEIDRERGEEAPRIGEMEAEYRVTINGERTVLFGASAEIAEQLVECSTAYRDALERGNTESANLLLRRFHAAHDRFPEITQRDVRDRLTAIWAQHFELMLTQRLNQGVFAPPRLNQQEPQLQDFPAAEEDENRRIRAAVRRIHRSRR